MGREKLSHSFNTEQIQQKYSNVWNKNIQLDLNTEKDRIAHRGIES